MANIKKSFNFRNGVQVDDDNLKVSGTGLVGIGTTVPTEALDVRGNVVVSGISSAVSLQAGVATITTLNPTEIIGAGVSIKSGIVTASSGIITYFGDGINLLNLPTSQWEDTIVGAGVSSIYNTGGNVGIATTAAVFTLQVGNDVNSGQKGVGISSFGDIKASGIITATTFSGNLSGNVTGNVTGTVSGNINSSLGTITDINATNINVSGLSTFAGITSVTGPVLHSKQLDISGISTMRGGISIPFPIANGGGDHLQIGFVKNNLQDEVGIASIGTKLGSQSLHLSAGGPNPDPNTAIFFHRNADFLQQIDVLGGATIRQSLNSSGINNTGNIDSTGNIQSSDKVIGDDGVESDEIAVGRATVSGVVGHPRMIHTTQNGPLKLAGHNSSGVEVEGLLLSKNELRGNQNITLNSNSGKIGVGTISPVGDIHLRRYTGNAEIQVTAETGTSIISLGKEASTGQTDHGELRYNSSAGGYDGEGSLSIVNWARGNINYMLSAANGNNATGHFNWTKGTLAGQMMILTNTGRLGIGISTPSTPLHVIGDGTVSGSLTVGNNLNISGTISANVSGNVTGNLTGNVNGNANAAAGISTFNNLSVAGIATFINVKSNSIGIGVDPTIPLTVNSTATNRFFVNANGNVGIKTTDTQAMNFMVAGSSVHQILGVGTTQPLSSVDFSTAGQQISGPFANKMFMIPPKVTNAQRGNLAGLVSGAMIYNTNLNKLQVYNGSAWETITSS